MSRLLLCGPARRGIQPAPAPVLGTITDLSATAGVESAVLAWTPAANATSHQPQHSDDGETWANFGSALSGSADGITVTGLTAGVEYSFRVIASDGSTQTISNTDTATPQAAPEWASGQWDLAVDGQPGALDFDENTVTLPGFGTVPMTALVSGDSATISFDLAVYGPGSMSLTHSDGSLSGTATVGSTTVPVTGQRPPAPGQLSAGTIVASPGDEQVTISEGAAPSGGTGGPYTSGLYRSLTAGQKGTLIVPALTLPYVDEDRTNGTTYFYTREVSDGQSTADTPQVSAMPQEPSAVLPLYETDFESYANNASVAGSGYNGWQWTPTGTVYVSTDIARSGSKSLKFSYGPTEPGGGSHWWSEQRFTHPQVTEYWVEFYIYFPDGTEGLGARYVHAANNQNNKFWTYWGPGYSDPPAGNASMWGMGNGDSNVGFINVGGGWSGAGLGPLVVGDADRGRWMQIRITIKIPDFGQSNGHMRLWKDGVLVTQRTGEPTRVSSPAQNYLSSGYLLGYDNARFTQDTFIYVDDLKFYTQDPGW